MQIKHLLDMCVVNGQNTNIYFDFLDLVIIGCEISEFKWF